MSMEIISTNYKNLPAVIVKNCFNLQPKKPIMNGFDAEYERFKINRKNAKRK